MDETQQRNGEVLNWLLQGATDSAQGFRQGADLARNPKLKSLFSERAQQREQLAGQIADEVRSFEQPPVERGTVVGEAHRAFTYLRDAISQDSDKGLIEELLRRERALSDKFQSAVDDTRLPSQARSVATAALPGFAETTDELAKIDQEYSGDSGEGSAKPGRFKLSDEDGAFLAVPPGAVVLSSGSDGAEGRIERSQDTVVRIGLQAVAVATSQGGSLSVAIEAGDGSSNGRDGPGPNRTAPDCERDAGSVGQGWRRCPVQNLRHASRRPATAHGRLVAGRRGCRRRPARGRNRDTPFGRRS